MSLDLFNNELDGEISPSLAECRFMNSLVRSENQFFFLFFDIAAGVFGV